MPSTTSATTRPSRPAIKETGKHFQAAVVYTISPVHSLDHYLKVARQLVDMGADSICIKDMAALLSPFYAEQLIARLKAEIDVPVQLHCHYIGGLAPMTYLKAIEAGVDVIDTATVPLAFGNSQPATEMVVTALIGTPYDSELDLEKLFSIAKYFEGVRREQGFERGVTSLTHMQVYSHQVPGGMISNLESQLNEQNALDRLPEVLVEIPVVRAEVGFPPLVTPMSQIVGTQAVLNVLSGRRWHIVPDEMKAYLRGQYGAAPGPVARDILERVLGDEQPITVRPAELLDETLADYTDEIGELARSEEDVLSYALFPQTARAFLERHRVGPESDVFGTHEQLPEGTAARSGADGRCRRSRARDPRDGRDERRRRGRDRRGRPEGHGAQGGAAAGPAARRRLRPPAAAPASDAARDARTPTPMATTSYARRWWPPSTAPPRRACRRSSRSAISVSTGQTLCILEAMKLMNELSADVAGVVRAIEADNGAGRRVRAAAVPHRARVTAPRTVCDDGRRPSRKQARRDALFVLYQREVTDLPLDELLANLRRREGYAPDEFTIAAVDGVIAAQAEIDARLEAQSRHWSL